MRTTILVTGATGHVGRHVVTHLLESGASVIAASTSPARLRERFGDAVTPARLDFLDPSTWREAIADATRVFLMRPPAIADVANTLVPFIDLAREQGVEHIVFLSVAGAGDNKFIPHRKVEDHLRSCGEDHTNLRPGFFAQNLESAYLEDIVGDDRIYVPAGRKQPVNWIDTRDIAEVATLILANPATHRGQSYTLAGPAPVPWSEVTRSLSEALERSIRYEPASLIGYMRHLSRRGLPRDAIMVQTILHFLLRFGQGANEDPTLERLLGRAPRTIHHYIQDHIEIWRRQDTP